MLIEAAGHILTIDDWDYTCLEISAFRLVTLKSFFSSFPALNSNGWAAIIVEQ
jgi:hypothetical protein